MSEENHEEMVFQIQRIYIKDISFKTPSVPNIFQQEWQPEVKLDLDTSSSKLVEHVYEVTLQVKVIITSVAKEILFLCKVQQAGIFSIDDIKKSQIVHCLSAYYPNILFPYSRECITNLVSRGTFPQLNLVPINFDALFMNYLQQQHTDKIENSTVHQEV